MTLPFSRREVHLDSGSRTIARHRQTYNSDRLNGDFAIRREPYLRIPLSTQLNLLGAWVWQLPFDSPAT